MAFEQAADGVRLMGPSELLADGPGEYVELPPGVSVRDAFTAMPPVIDTRAAALLAMIGDKYPRPVGYQVLITIYVRPEKTKGGIILTHSTRKEDIYQGIVGLVVAVGPDAYSDRTRYPSAPWVKRGDWVIWPSYQNQSTKFAMDIGAAEPMPMAFLNDDQLRGIVADPDMLEGIK